jgi:hypothetical protein
MPFGEPDHHQRRHRRGQYVEGEDQRRRPGERQQRAEQDQAAKPSPFPPPRRRPAVPHAAASQGPRVSRHESVGKGGRRGV